MSEAFQFDWHEANQRYLMTALTGIRRRLERHVAESGEEWGVDDVAIDTDHALNALAAQMPTPPAVEVLCRLFDLSTFERDLLLLCAGIELDARFPALCAAAQGHDQRTYVTFGLALALLADTHWSALAPDAPLRHWQLIQVEPSRALVQSPLQIDERILHFLTGVEHLDERLAALVRLLPVPADLVPSHQALAETLAATWLQGTGRGSLPAVQLCGAEIEDKRAIAAAACSQLGLALYVMPLAALPANQPGELHRLLRLWQRDARLSRRALLLDCDDDGQVPDATAAQVVAQLLASNVGVLIISSRARQGPWQQTLLAFDVARPSGPEQKQLWTSALGDHAHSLNGQIDQLVAQFDLNAPRIWSACTAAQGQLHVAGAEASPKAQLAAAIWERCRVQARPQLDDLAQRIEPVATWDELILPPTEKEILREAAMHVRQRSRVYESWGFVSKGKRGLGISALFAGASGTGKTMAAEVLAHELQLDLYRIDLSAVVSKYIGETEKNLRRVFDAAETSGAILLFDEADALFGKRSEVKDSHDRHANIEVSYLLQRMEAYRGLAILTTNLKEALDSAFLRRIRFIVQFPFPDTEQRAAIWHSIFPAAMPREGLDVAKLARLNVPGGNIRNIALNAAFLAADADEAVQMSHLLQAARREYTKLERSLTAAEIRGWVES